MQINNFIYISILSLCLVSTSWAGETTLVTYYPSPKGSYRNIAVGDTVTARNVTASGDVKVGADATNPKATITAVDGKITTQGSLTTTGNVTVNGDMAVIDAASGNITSKGGLTTMGDVTVNGGQAKITASNGNLATKGSVVADGSLTAAGVTSSSGVTVTGGDISAQTGNVTAVNLIPTTAVRFGGVSGPTLSASGNEVQASGNLRAVDVTSTGRVTATTGIISNGNVAVGGTKLSLNATNGDLNSEGTISSKGLIIPKKSAGANVPCAGQEGCMWLE